MILITREVDQDDLGGISLLRKGEGRVRVLTFRVGDFVGETGRPGSSGIWSSGQVQKFVADTINGSYTTRPCERLNYPKEDRRSTRKGSFDANTMHLSCYHSTTMYLTPSMNSFSHSHRPSIRRSAETLHSSLKIRPSAW